MFEADNVNDAENASSGATTAAAPTSTVDSKREKKGKYIKAWFAKVLAAGGLQHLLTILQGLDLEACLTSMLGTNCLMLLLNLLHHLLRMRREAPESASTDGSSLRSVGRCVFSL